MCRSLSGWALRRYYLADDTISVYEPPQKNTGVMGGKFLQRGPHRKSDGSKFKPSEFHVGATVEILKHRFNIISTNVREWLPSRAPVKHA